MKTGFRCALVLSASAAIASFAIAQKPAPPAPRPPSAAATDDYFLPLMPRFVAGPMVSKAAWSPDGRYVAAVVEDYEVTAIPSAEFIPSRTLSLIIWTSATHRSAVVWSTPDLRAEIQDVKWFPGSPVAFVSANLSAAGDVDAGIWRVDARRGSAKRLEGMSGDESLFVSPNQPYAFLVSTSGRTATVRPLSSAGVIGSPVPLPLPATFATGWTRDGSGLAFAPLLRAPKDVAAPVWQILDARTGRVTRTENRPVRYRYPEPTFPFRMNLEKTKLSFAPPVEMPWTNGEQSVLWLEQGTAPKVDRMLLSPAAQRFEVSPRGDAVLYLNHEGAFVVSLLRVSKKAMEQARETAQRIQIMNNGKQIAMGVIMWASDHEDMIPAADGLRERLQPYLKSDDVFQSIDGGGSFVYSLNGGVLTAIQDPANTMMGYIPGPGGYAVVYVDGHVQWHTELPTTPPAG